MNTVYRNITYRLYPPAQQETALLAQKQAHQCLYNAALEQRRTAWKRCCTSLSYVEQCKDLTALRQADPDSVPINAQAAQVTLKRLDLAFQHFLTVFFAWMGTYHLASGTVRAVERSLNGSSAKQGFLLRSIRVDVERFKQEHRT